MTIFRGPYREHIIYSSKFLRIGETIAVTLPNDTRTSHRTLAETDGLMALIEDAEPNNLDAGLMLVMNGKMGGKISLVGNSEDLEIFSSPGTRIRSAEVVGDGSPGYRMRTDAEQRGKERW